MMQRFRERLTLILLAALPFHALLVTAGTRVLQGPGHAPMTVLALWKEALLGVILLLVIVEVACSVKRATSGKRLAVSADSIDVLAAALIVLALIVTAAMRVDAKTALFGFKYDFLPIVAFLVARRVPWSAAFQSLLGRVLLLVGCIVAAYGIVSFVLPQQFFFWLGYSPVHSLYFADTPLAAFQQIGDTSLRRIQSVMSGPNQLGLWLLLPWCIALVRLLKERRAVLLLPLGFIGLALLMSFSRSAFIGAFLATLIGLRIGLPPKLAKRAFLSVLSISLVLGVVLVLLFPKVFWRLGSTRGHLTRPILAMQEVIAHPLGLGIGMAGPASTHLRDTCVFLRAQDDPAWAKNIPDLCVFVGGVKVQPADRDCTCPNLPENWYVQMGTEAGVLGFALFLALTITILAVLARSRQVLSLPAFLAFLGIAIAALFLHAWEDSAVAYTLWLLTGFSLSFQSSQAHQRK